MKILLVAPCPAGEQRHKSMDIPQLTLALIAGMTPEEHEVEICEEVYGQEIPFDGNYDLIGITIMTQTSIRGYEVANEFKKRDKLVVFGGIHATTMPEEALLFGDAVVVGEAEGLWPQVIEDARKNNLREIYKLDCVPDLQTPLFPRRDLIQCKAGKFALAPMETTRGCPYNCDFCTVSRFFGVKQRHKRIVDIITEIESLPQKFLFFQDDNITGDKRFAKELFKEMAPLNKLWAGQASVNLSKDPELMDLAYKAGCRGLLIGFESMTDDGLSHYRKTLKSVDANVEAVQNLRDHGIMTMASLVFGLDTDTENVFDISREFLNRSKSSFFQSCVLTPYPGTPVFNSLREQGRILTDDWSKYDATKVLIQPKNFSPEFLLKATNEIQREIYSNRNILFRSLPQFKLGFTTSLLYFTLNKGYQHRHRAKRILGVQRNKPGFDVDFDITKYVVPVKKKKQ